MEAQKALLTHAIKHKIDWHLRDDHWGRTGYAILSLFEAGTGLMRYDDQEHDFSSLTKQVWSDVHGPLCGTGGFHYRDPADKIIFKISTWVS